MLRATWAPTVSQFDWLETGMHLIPAVADFSAADSIKSVSCFLFKTQLCDAEARNPIVALPLHYEWNYMLKKHSKLRVFNLHEF